MTTCWMRLSARWVVAYQGITGHEAFIDWLQNFQMLPHCTLNTASQPRQEADCCPCVGNMTYHIFFLSCESVQVRFMHISKCWLNLSYLVQDINEAMSRLPPGELEARNQRLKRASDCSLKKSYLPKDVQQKQTPYQFYLRVGITFHILWVEFWRLCSWLTPLCQGHKHPYPTIIIWSAMSRRPWKVRRYDFPQIGLRHTLVSWQWRYACQSWQTIW